MQNPLLYVKLKKKNKETDLSLLGHTPETGIPPRLVAHLPAPTADVTEWQQGFSGVVQRDLQMESIGLNQCDLRFSTLTSKQHRMKSNFTNLRPSTLGCVSSVTDPPSAADTGVPLLLRREVGREINGILPSLKIRGGRKYVNKNCAFYQLKGNKKQK